MANEKVVGLDLLQYGSIHADGSISQTLITLDKIVENSAILVFEPDIETDFLVEDQDDPEITIRRKGIKRLEFACYVFDNTDLILAHGGTASGASIWLSPRDSIGVTERSFKVTTKTYDGVTQTFELARCSVSAGADIHLKASQPGQQNFSCKVLQPDCTSAYPVKRTIA